MTAVEARSSVWEGGVVPLGHISGRQAAASRAYSDAVRRKRQRDARRERLFVASVGGFIGALMALSGRWVMDRGIRRA